MWKIRALFLVPVLTAAAVAAWASWQREPDPAGAPGAAVVRRPGLARVEAFTADGYARYRATYPDPADDPGAARRAFLASAHRAGEHVAAYRAVEPEHAAEAFRELAHHVVPSGRLGGLAPDDALPKLIAAHEARCGPDPDPVTVLLKAALLVREGRFAEAEPLAARAAAAFPVPPAPPPGVRDGSWEYLLARECMLGVYVGLGRWKGPGPFAPPPGASVVEVFWQLYGADRLDDAGHLLDRADGVAPPDRALTRCRALLEYRRGRWAECLAAAEAYRAGTESDIGYEQDVGVCRAKALARLGRFAEADRTLAEARGPDRPWYDPVERAEFVVALLAGDADRAGRLLADGRLIQAGVLQDDEVRPLWQADDRFAALRAEYPTTDRPRR